MFLGYILRERDNLIQGKKFIFLNINKKGVNLCASECVSLPRVKVIKKNQLPIHTGRLVASITLHLCSGIKTEMVMKSRVGGHSVCSRNVLPLHDRRKSKSALRQDILWTLKKLQASFLWAEMFG